MHKKIYGLCFIIASSFLLSMEEQTVTLGYLGNKSDTLYIATYGPGHKAILHSRQGLNVSQPLFCLLPDQQFPVSEKIVFSESSPEAWLFPEQAQQRMRALHLEMVAYLLKIKSPLKEENHVLEPDEKYVLHVGIDHMHNLFYTLKKLYRMKK